MKKPSFAKFFSSDTFDYLGIIALGLLTFGLQIPWLGYFFDDWNFVFYASARGAQGLIEFLLLDGRPAAAWVYILGFATLGYKPMLWQILSITLRILTTICFWQIMKIAWPLRRLGNLVAAFFFLAYPFFTLQPLSVAYAPHFVSYLFYSISLLFMVKALQRPDRYLIYTSVSVLAAFVQVITTEYFVGLELIRPLAVWFFLSSEHQNTFREKIRKTLLMWLPYLLILVFFVVWRSLLSSELGIRNNPLTILTDSGQTLSILLRNIWADIILILITSWFKLVDPNMFVIGPIQNLYVLLLSILGGVCFYHFSSPASRNDADVSDSTQVISAGILTFAAGMLSSYTVGYIVHLKVTPWNSRFSLPALLGAALIISGTIDTVITSKVVRRIFLAILIGLLVGWQNRNTFAFKGAWEKQERLYEQLIWRAPSIEPNTAIIANEEILSYMGDYPTSFGINSMYGTKQTNNVPYWFFMLSQNFFDFSADRLIDGGKLDYTRTITTFHGDSQKAIFITYEPENGQCLWVIRPQDHDYKFLPPEIKKASQISNYQRIKAESNVDFSLYHDIVNENKDTWCYFYQTADLARQTKDWPTVIVLWEEAQSKGHRPENGFEYLPFIEANAKLGNWQEAYQLSRNANKASQAMYFILCPTWQSLVQETPPSAEKDNLANEVNNLLKCNVP